jgi:hypothetical protein
LEIALIVGLAAQKFAEGAEGKLWGAIDPNPVSSQHEVKQELLGTLGLENRLARMSIFSALNTIGKVYEKVHDSVEAYNKEATVANNISKIGERVVEILNNVDGITTAHSRDFSRATPLFTLRDGTLLKTFRNPAQVDHIFVADSQGNMVFAGFVFWKDKENLQKAIAEIKRELS